MVDQPAEYGPDLTLTYSKDECKYRNHIPLAKFQEVLNNINWINIKCINFSHGYCTDAVLKIISSQKKTFENLEEVNLRGCQLVTDIGLKWLSQVLSGMKKIKKVFLEGCIQVTDKGLSFLLDVTPLSCDIHLCNTQVAFITSVTDRYIYNMNGSFIPRDINCKSYTSPRLLDREKCDGHIVIVSHKSVERSLCSYISSKSISMPRFNYSNTGTWTVVNHKWQFNITDVQLENPMFDMFAGSSPVQVIVPFGPSANLNDVADHVTETVSRIISQEIPSKGFEPDSTVDFEWFVKLIDSEKYDLQMTYKPLQESPTSVNSGTYASKFSKLALDNPASVAISDVMKVTFDKKFRFGGVDFPTQVLWNVIEKGQDNLESDEVKSIGIAAGGVVQELLKKNKADINRFRDNTYGRSKQSITVKQGDTIELQICGAEMSDEDFLQNQPVKVILKLNDKEVLSKKYHYNVKGGKDSSVGLFPCNLLVHKAAEDKAEKEESDKQSNAQASYLGCNILVVAFGVDKESRIEANKHIEQLRHLMNFSKSGRYSVIKDKISQYERQLHTLDLQDQQNYADLCRFKENFELFLKQPERLQYKSLIIGDEESVTHLKTYVIQNFEMHKRCFPQKYISSSFTDDDFAQLKAEVRDKGQFTLARDVYERLANKKSHKNAEIGKQMVQLLQEKGYLVSFHVGNDLVVASTTFAAQFFDQIYNEATAPKKSLGSNTTSSSVGKETLYWDYKTFVFRVSQSKAPLLSKMLETCGHLKLPVYEEDKKQKHWGFIPLRCICPSESLEEFYTPEGSKLQDFVVMERLYTIPCTCVGYILSMFVSEINQYGKLILATPNGAVTQLGAVQSVVLQQKPFGETTRIILQSKCFQPKSADLKTCKDVREYTYLVFSLYTDLMDRILKRNNIVAVINQDVDHSLVNSSFGCKHSWVRRSTVTLCTLCNKCCSYGDECEYFGTEKEILGKCPCNGTAFGCDDCGLCTKCVKDLWLLRSELRPMLGCGSFESCKIEVPLDPLCFNEVSFTNLWTRTNGLYLQDILAGNDSQKFSVPDILPLKHDVIKLRLTDPLGAITMDRDCQLDSSVSNVTNSHVIYRFIFHRYIRVSHDLGVLCYEGDTYLGNGYAVAFRPFSESLQRFSVKIINGGLYNHIYIGACTKSFGYSSLLGNKFPSVSIHNADGEIMLYDERKQRKVKTSVKIVDGSIVTVEIDVVQKKLTYYLNDQEIYSGDVQIPEQGFYPAINLKSMYSAVQLMEVEPWLPQQEYKGIVDPPTLDIYKYGNLWISPGKALTKLSKYKDDQRKYSAPIVFYNPTKNYIAYWIDLKNKVFKNPIGILSPHEIKSFTVRFPGSESMSEVKIFWTAAEIVADMKEREITDKFKAIDKENIYIHKILVPVELIASSSTRLVNVNERGPQVKANDYLLEILKDGHVVSSYWLKASEYFLEKPLQAGQYLLQCPRYPVYYYPSDVQRGMKTVIKVKRDDGCHFHEAVVSSVKNDKYTLEYTLSENNRKEITMDSKTMNWNKSEVPESVVVNKYYELPSQRLFNQTLVSMPPDLMSKGALHTLEKVGANWMVTALHQFGMCHQNFNRVTFKERQILSYQSQGHECPKIFLPQNLSKKLLVHPPITKLFSDMTVHRLCPGSNSEDIDHNLPNIPELYGSLGPVEQNYRETLQKKERLENEIQILADKSQNGETDEETRNMLIDCKDQLKALMPEIKACEKTIKATTQKMINGIPSPSLHFMNLPGMTPDTAIPAELVCGYQCQYNVYRELITTQIILPSTCHLLDPDSVLQNTESLRELMHIYVSVAGVICIKHNTLHQVPMKDDTLDHTKKLHQHIRKSELKPIPYSQLSMDQPDFVSIENPVSNDILFSGCKAHLMTLTLVKDALSLDQSIHLAKEFYSPYAQYVTILDVSCSGRHPKVASIHKDFFTSLQNLRFIKFNSADCHSVVLPHGLGQLKYLQSIDISDCNISTLPADMMSGPSVTEVRCNNLPLRSLKLDLAPTSLMTKLSLQNLGLREVPEAVCGLTALEVLILDYNPISSLPVRMDRLTKLQKLSVKAIPLLMLEDFDFMTKEQYMMWYKLYHGVTEFVSLKEAEKLFEEFDENKNGLLESKELAGLNMKLLFMIPRLGIQSGFDQYGGIPKAIYSLQNLQYLYLTHQGIAMVTDDVKHLMKLCELDVSHCPLLEGLSGFTGEPPNLHTINLRGCSRLRTPPLEVASRGFFTVKSYLGQIAKGYTPCRRTKLMFVGLGEAGKTSLLQALMSKDKKIRNTKTTTLTDGIEITNWTVPHKGFELVFSCWDFAGQTVYYNTHQFFLSKRAVYMLLWNMRMGFEHAGLEFWLSSIACHAPNSPVFIIGTQSDVVPIAEIPEKKLKRQFNQIVGFFYVSSITGSGIAELEERLIAETLSQKYMGEKVPKSWLQLESRLLEKRKNQNFLPWKEVEKIALKSSIYGEHQLREALNFLDGLGTVQYFENDFLQDRIVINPQWIVDIMACLVSVKSPVKENDGRLLHKDMKTIWEGLEELHPWLLRLTEEFDLTFPLPKENVNLVPCLLPVEPPDDFKWPKVDKKNGHMENKMVYTFNYLPTGLFNRVQVRLFQFSDGKMIWKNGSLLQKNKHLALMKIEGDSSLVVTVQGPQPENVLMLIHEVIEGLIQDLYNGVKPSLYIPCPECITQSETKEPYLFHDDIIHKAKVREAPFLQCLKDFHIISLEQLFKNMPEDKNSDLDLLLQQSMNTLDSLEKNMMTDIALLFCKEDAQRKNDKSHIHPLLIKEDIEKWGYTVWVPDDIKNIKIPEMVTGIRKCRIVVACISDCFDRDPEAKSLFICAKEQLKKDIIVCVIHDNLIWTNTELGMKVGNPTMAMLKTVDRYDKKMPDLKKLINQYIADLDKKKSEHPSVFLSYCWANSADAVSKGTAGVDGLGAYDPRWIKSYLEESGLKCWLDIDQIGKNGLYQDIASGLGHCKVVVAFISDQYVQSNNCMMEFEHAVNNMKLPVVVAVVGKGDRWRESRVPLLLCKVKISLEDVIYLREENEAACIKLLTEVQKAMPAKEEKTSAEKTMEKLEARKKEIENSAKKAERLKIAYQEEYELIQRKFLRHVINVAEGLDAFHVPHLIVYDFVNTVLDTGFKKDNLKQNIRPKSSKLRRMLSNTRESEEDDSWKEQEFCLKILCEHEEGWHVCENSISGLFNYASNVESASAYLARIYNVLSQSGVQLNCFSGILGRSFIQHVDVHGRPLEHFKESYDSIVKLVLDLDQNEQFTSQLNRCHLPSGKIAWLCRVHSSMNRITKLPKGTAKSVERTLIRKEDELLLEGLQSYEPYMEWLNKQKFSDDHTQGDDIRTSEKAVDLPEDETIMKDAKQENVQNEDERNAEDNNSSISDTSGYDKSKDDNLNEKIDDSLKEQKDTRKWPDTKKTSNTKKSENEQKPTMSDLYVNKDASKVISAGTSSEREDGHHKRFQDKIKECNDRDAKNRENPKSGTCSLM